MLRTALVALALAVVIPSTPLRQASPPPPASPTTRAPSPGTPSPGATPVVRHHRPLRAPVVDSFHLDDGPYGAGNRGWEYATAPGTVVRATATGTVAFAGTVAGQRYVSVEHADGIRSTYSYLGSVTVVVGQAVTGGHALGTTGTTFQIGFRRGDTYLDPAGLFERQVVRLVSDDRFGR